MTRPVSSPSRLTKVTQTLRCGIQSLSCAGTTVFPVRAVSTSWCRQLMRESPTRSRTILNDSSYPDVTWKPLPDRQSLTAALAKPAADGFAAYLRASNPLEALNRLGDFPNSMRNPTRAVWGREREPLLSRKRWRERSYWKNRAMIARGRPILVTRNDYHLRLFMVISGSSPTIRKGAERSGPGLTPLMAGFGKSCPPACRLMKPPSQSRCTRAGLEFEKSS